MVSEPSTSTSPDNARLDFEREKWRAEHDLRKQELEMRRTELSRSRWVNPLVIAVFAAAAAGLGNAAISLMNSSQQFHLEREKAEAARILEVVKTNDPDKAAGNLKFLSETGLIADRTTRKAIQVYLTNREPGKGVVLPSTFTADRSDFGRRQGIVCRFPLGSSVSAVAEIKKSLEALGLVLQKQNEGWLEFSGTRAIDGLRTNEPVIARFTRADTNGLFAEISVGAVDNTPEELLRYFILYDKLSSALKNQCAMFGSSRGFQPRL